MENRAEIAAALRQVARGIEALADAVAQDDTVTQDGRVLAVLREWADKGLDRGAASALFRRHGLSPQASGGWARGHWIETRSDGLRYLTDRSWRWMAEQNGGRDE